MKAASSSFLNSSSYIFIQRPYSSRHPQIHLPRLPFLLFFFSIFFLLCPSVSARIDNFTISSTDNLIELVPPFGFYNGSLELNLVIKSPDPDHFFYVVLFNSVQWQNVQQKKRELTSSSGPTTTATSSPPTTSSDAVCFSPSTMRYEISAEHTFHSTSQIYSFDQYHLSLMNCQKTALTVQGDAIFLNENGSHLSIEEKPLVFIYSILIMGYISSAFLWGTYYYKTSAPRQPGAGSTSSTSTLTMRNRMLMAVGGWVGEEPNNMGFHSYFVVILMGKMIELSLNIVFYEMYSITGYPFFWLKLTIIILKIFTELLLMAIILSVSMGWWITSRTPTMKERQIFWGSFITYSVFVILYEFCEDPMTLCFAYLLSLQVVKGLFTFGTGMAISANIGQMRSNMNNNNGERNVRDEWRIKALGTLLWVIPIYLLFPIALMCLQFAVLYWERSWIVLALNELLYLITLFVVIYSLTPVGGEEEGEHVGVVDSRREDLR